MQASFSELREWIALEECNNRNDEMVKKLQDHKKFRKESEAVKKLNVEMKKWLSFQDMDNTLK